MRNKFADLCKYVVRFIGLALDYWHTNIFMAIAKGVGITVRIDQVTTTKDLGMFSRV